MTRSSPTSLLLVLVVLLAAALPAAASRSGTTMPAAPFTVETFATSLGFATDMVFATDGALYYVDTYSKRVKGLDAGGVESVSFRIPDQGRSLGQVMGLALDPDFAANSTFYVHYVDSRNWSNVVVRFQYLGGASGMNAVILLDLPLPPVLGQGEEPCVDHNGGHLHVGPDGALYVPMGDNCQGDLAQDTTRGQGAVLRISAEDGSALPDNPFYDGDGPNDDRIWATGLRNPFGSTFDPWTNAFWVSENGPGCGDEVNRIERGQDYGWPVSSSHYFDCHDPGPPHVAPDWEWSEPVAPTGIVAYTGVHLPAWRQSLLVCTWRGGELYRLTLDQERKTIVSAETIDIAPATCQLDVEIGPDGHVYLLSPNTIYRLVTAPVWLPMQLKS